MWLRRWQAAGCVQVKAWKCESMKATVIVMMLKGETDAKNEQPESTTNTAKIDAKSQLQKSKLKNRP